MQPAISCVIPVFNGKRDVERAVRSALGQRPDAQVVLVDDCSTDGTRELVLALARGDPRIVGILLTVNRGQAYARNVGVGAADAPYVAFLDHDDEHLPGWYDHALEALERRPEYVGVRGEIELADLPPDIRVDRSDPRWPAIVNSVVWNVVMHKVVYQAVGGSPCGAAFRMREANEDWALTETIKRHYLFAKSEYPAVRHYVGAGRTAYFLRRTRVTAGGFEFTENTPSESQGTLAEALADYQERAAANVGLLRNPARPQAATPAPAPGGLMSRVMRKLTGG